MIGFLEKKFKIDLRYFIGGGSWLFLGQVVAASKAIIMSVFLARFFGIEEFGKFAYIMAVFSMANIFGAPGMSIAIFQSVSRGFEGTLRYLIKKIFFIGLLGSLFFVFFQLYFNLVQHESNHYIFLVLALLFPFYSVSTNFAYYISGLKKFKDRTYFEILMNLFILFSAFAIFLIKKDIYYLIIVIIFSQTIISLAYLYYLIKNSNNKIDYDACGYGKALNWNYVIPTIKLQLDKIFISNFLGYDKTATYNVAYSFGEQVTTAAKVLGALIVPKTSNLTKKEIKGWLNFRNIVLVMLVFFGFSTVVMLLIPFIIKILYGSSYMGAIPFAQVMLFFIPLRSFSLILRNINESQKNVKIINIASNHISIIEIFLMLVGLLVFGIWGLIFAKIVVDCISVVWQLVHIYQENEE
jgi:O-antigen/teichoic acid export membrane protein